MSIQHELAEARVDALFLDDVRVTVQPFGTTTVMLRVRRNRKGVPSLRCLVPLSEDGTVDGNKEIQLKWAERPSTEVWKLLWRALMALRVDRVTEEQPGWVALKGIKARAEGG